MTYVEFYDKNSIENICACLTMLPDEVILVGNDKKVIEKHAENCEKVFAGREQNVKFSCKIVSRWSASKVVETIEEIIETHDDCVFGITGGDEMVVFALGIVCERERQRNRGKNVQVHKINIQDNKIHDCDMDGEVIEQDIPQLSVAENVQIYGGEISVYDWDMTPDFEKDIEDIWNICKVNPAAWNAQIGVLGTIKEKSTSCADGLTITAEVAKLIEYYSKNRGHYNIEGPVKEALLDKGLLLQLEEKDGIVTVTFKNKQVKKCLTVAGQALEMKIYLTARRIKGKRNKTDVEESVIYNDVKTGVTIDWDGVDQTNNSEEIDVINEIDVLMMHDMVPIFVSCKNGWFSADEFYKLNTVADRFGGKYAKKVLITSTLDVDLKNEDKPELMHRANELKQRASDMNIKIITGDHLMDDKQLENKLKNVWC